MTTQEVFDTVIRDVAFNMKLSNAVAAQKAEADAAAAVQQAAIKRLTLSGMSEGTARFALGVQFASPVEVLLPKPAA